MAAPNWKELEEHIQQVMQIEHIPGLAIAISQKGEVLYQNGFGVRDLDERKPVTPETIFGIASVTKSFTAMAIYKLEENGYLSVNDPVIKYIPEFNLRGVRNMEKIKIYHLLSHTTGLPPMERREKLDRLEDHTTYLAHVDVEMLGEPGEYFSYCNDTFLLLGIIIERITGKLYRRYMTNHILEPLDMNRSTFSLEEVSKFDNVSIPYIYNKKNHQFEKQSWPKLGNYEVGGGIRSNVLDLLKYGQGFVGQAANYPYPISGSSLEKMWKPIYQISQDSFYGSALTINHNYSGMTLVEHGGGQPGVSSHFGFIPEHELVIAILTNVSAAPTADIWLTAVNASLNLPLEQRRSVEPIYNISTDEFELLEGTYGSLEGGRITILMEKDQLVAKIEDEHVKLEASTKDKLVISKTRQPLQFYFKQDRKAWGVLFGSRILQRER